MELENGKMSRAFIVRLSNQDALFDAYVDPEKADIVQLVDYSSRYSYKVVPITR